MEWEGAVIFAMVIVGVHINSNPGEGFASAHSAATDQENDQVKGKKEPGDSCYHSRETMGDGLTKSSVSYA